ncbi:metal ABC transporter substrate-binding protein, partial [Shewanella sp. C31]|nr:metal ABC transporter substrate-binding protein [Shewanella electrica]
MRILRVLGPWLLSLWASLALAQGVVPTTPILASIGEAVAGGRFRIESVVPPGADPHAFDLRPSVVRQLAEARLLMANGLGLEPYLPRLKALLPPGAEVLELAPRMPDPVCGLLGLREKGVHLHGDCDPHMWLDPTYGVRYAEAMAQAFARLDPAGEAQFRRNLEAFRARALAEDEALGACLRG